jgi:hypothetical protein
MAQEAGANSTGESESSGLLSKVYGMSVAEALIYAMVLVVLAGVVWMTVSEMV